MSGGVPPPCSVSLRYGHQLTVGTTLNFFTPHPPSALVETKTKVCFNEGYTNFPKMWGPFQNSTHQNGDLQILGATVRNVVTRATWRPEFLHPMVLTRLFLCTRAQL
jgi:hypothetical protein